jgi:type VI secretion system protein ImpF
MLDHSSIRESVVRDLSRLLNTRAPLFGPVPERAPQTVLNYGIPDFSALSPDSSADAEALAALMVERISRFEPRLADVRVSLVKHPQSHNSLLGVIYANLILGEVREPVSFPLLFDAGADVVEVIESPVAA